MRRRSTQHTESVGVGPVNICTGGSTQDALLVKTAMRCQMNRETGAGLLPSSTAHLRLWSSACPLQCLHVSQPWSGLDRHKTSSANYRPARRSVHADDVELAAARRCQLHAWTRPHAGVRNSFCRQRTWSGASSVMTTRCS